VSVATLTTIAATRERAQAGAKPKKGDIGKVPAAHSKATANASVADVLAKQIPTELIAPYTALTAAIVGSVAKPTVKNPHPDQLSGWRWAAFAVLIGSVILLVWFGKRQKTDTWNFPVAAVVAGVVCAGLWAFIMPGSPLVPYLGKTADTLVPLFVAVVGVVVAAGTASLLVSPKK
jgi:Na+-translocating ferredoxin:NAD+ oxidoreductase RnfD subunit